MFLSTSLSTTRTVGMPYFTFRFCRTTVGIARQVAGMGASFLVPSLEDWQKALDQGNIEAAVVYPTRFMHIGQVGMVDFAVDLSRAYNDYLYDRFLSQESRLKGIAVLPLQDVGAAVVELRRAVKDYGMVGGLLPADGLPRPLGHQDFYPLYEEANRLGCMMAVHSQNSLRNNDPLCGAKKQRPWPMFGRRCASLPTSCFPAY